MYRKICLQDLFYPENHEIVMFKVSYVDQNFKTSIFQDESFKMMFAGMFFRVLLLFRTIAK